MDQNQTPSFEIPKSHEVAHSLSGTGEQDSNFAIEGTREILPAPQPTAVPSSQPIAGTSPMTALPIADPQATSHQVTGASQASDAHLVADDVDVIEKEWVDRAKKVVSLTSNDPYLEARELNKLKNTYMRKRFNKELPEMTEGK